jgi:hypothetical protein
MAKIELGELMQELTEEKNRIDITMEKLGQMMRGRFAPAPSTTKKPTSHHAKKSTPIKALKPMPEATKAKLRANYAKTHPGWKPKKK